MSLVPWLVLLGAVPALEVVARRRGPRVARLGELGARIDSTLPGRVVLLGLWAFVGIHVFCRYTPVG